MSRLLKKLWTDESAISATEYGIIAAVFGAGLITILVAFRKKIAAMFTKVGEQVENAPGKAQ